MTSLLDLSNTSFYHCHFLSQKNPSISLSLPVSQQLIILPYPAAGHGVLPVLKSLLGVSSECVYS